MLEEYLAQKQAYINERIEAFMPSSLTKDFLDETFFYFNNRPIIESMTEPIRDIISRGGKRWRPIFMILCCDALGGGSKIEDFIPLIEIIHNGTLIIDDIEDGACVRRGGPALHHLYGTDVSINAGNLMYFLPQVIIERADLDSKTKLALYGAVNEELMRLHVGQGADIYWHNGGEHITETLYLKMCALKTGTLARMSAAIGAIIANANKVQIRRIKAFAETIGVAFQIQDDILNVTNKTWGKSFGDDITEGKRSLMVIRVLEIGNVTDKERLKNILSQNTHDMTLIEEAVRILKRYDTITYAQKKAQQLVEHAWRNLDRSLPESDAKHKLKLFADFLILRTL